MQNRHKDITEKLNGDLTDPLNVNILIYSCTYILSILCSVIPYVVQFESKNFEVARLLRTITDSIVPTTATLVLGNTIQSIVLIGQARITRFALSIWSLIAVIAYMLLYALCRVSQAPWLDVGAWLGSVGIVVLEMYAIAQVEDQKHRNIKSLSG